MERAVRAHVGELQPALVTDSERTIDTYEESREVLGSNSEIAEAAGYGAPGQYPRGSPEWKARQTFMRRLQRYEQFRTGGGGQARNPRGAPPRIIIIARIEATRQNTPATLADVIRLMGMRGTTSLDFEARVKVSSDERWRKISAAVYTAQSVYRSVGWPMRGRSPDSGDEWLELGLMYGQAFLIAYGMPSAYLVDDGSPLFLFTIGREDGVIYDYT